MGVGAHKYAQLAGCSYIYIVYIDAGRVRKASFVGWVVVNNVTIHNIDVNVSSGCHAIQYMYTIWVD